jgi:serine/threonine-protein kinase
LDDLLEVYAARDGELPREVAFKRLQPRHAQDAYCRARFVREAEITSRLEHPSVVPVYGRLYDEGPGRPALTGGDRRLALRRLLGRFVATDATDDRPALAAAWQGLGEAHQRAGRPRLAEPAFERERNPSP